MRHFVTADQQNWPGLLDITQFSYNMQKSSITGYSPFELVNGQMPLAPHTVLPRGFGRSPHAKRLLTAWEENLEIAWMRLYDAAERMKKQADKGRTDAHFDVGDKVYLRITGDQYQPPKGTARSLTRRYDGPFCIKKRIGEVSYELELLDHMHSRHPVFHISQLKRGKLDVDDPDQAAPPRGPAMIIDKPDLVVEKILDLRTIGVAGNARR